MENVINLIEDEAIDVSDYNISPSKGMRSVSAYDKTLCGDNKLLKSFLDKCILLDPTFGMENIIGKVLLPAYVCADEEYKHSEKFQRVLRKALSRLIQDPDKKYSHLSDVLDTLKLHGKQIPKKRNAKMEPRKKVAFVTLSNTVSGNLDTSNRKRHNLPLSSDKVHSKKPKLDLIAIDDEDDDVIPIDDMVTPADTEATDVDKENENIADEAPYEIPDSQEVKIIEEVQTDDTEQVNIANEIVINIEEHEQGEENLSNIASGDNLLIPRKEIFSFLPVQEEKKKKPDQMSEVEKNVRIKQIEAEIERTNKKIKELELAEVTDDSAVSPYIQCSKLEAHIVKLHKELCRLVDIEPVKARKVRLQVLQGQPEGPLRRLERFLNRHVDEDGVAPFPDFNDVVQCVTRANVKDGLGWNKAKIFREAQAIFSYCGRALQKRRQEREWRHMLSRVAASAPAADPADTNPELRAKLELHKQLAAAKEAETLERFCRMESMAAAKKDPQTADKMRENHPDPNIGNETMDSMTESEISCITESNNNETCRENDSIVHIKQEPVEFPPIQYKGDISLVIEISDSEHSDDEL